MDLHVEIGSAILLEYGLVFPWRFCQTCSWQ